MAYHSTNNRVTNIQTPTWDDFHNEDLGPKLPLSDEARKQGVSGVLPSGESNGLDLAQQGSGINRPFPYPNTNTPDNKAFPSGHSRSQFPDQFSDDWWAASGIVKTYGPVEGALVDQSRESGIFHFDELFSQFSNAQNVAARQIDDFTIFNMYIHHERLPSNAIAGNLIEIPFVSTYRTSIDFNAYNGWQGFGG